MNAERTFYYVGDIITGDVWAATCPVVEGSGGEH